MSSVGPSRTVAGVRGGRVPNGPGGKKTTDAGRFARACSLAVWVVVLLAGAGGLRGQESGELRDLGTPLVCVSHDTFFPYAFVDGDNAAPKGFSVDVMEALSRQMQLKLKWLPVPSENLGDYVSSGKADVVVLLAETKARRNVFDFSVPVLRFETVVVVRASDKSIHGISDLKGCRIGVGQKGTVAEVFVQEQVPGAIMTYSASKEEQLRELETGNADAVVTSRLTALSTIDRYGLKDLRILEPVKGYDIRYCFAVRKGDSLLLARLNEGLALLHRDGIFDEIYQRWFGRYERRSFTSLQVVSYVAGALALVCVGAMWGFLRQRNLLGRIEKQAAELTEQRSLLAALYDKHPLATVVLDIPLQGVARVVSVNQEAVLLFGREKAECVDRELDKLDISGELKKYLEEVVLRFQVHSRPERWEVQLPNSRRLLEVATMPLGLQGYSHRVCVISADITKRRLMDQEIAKSRRLRALGELVGGIAHEFNNLLTPILATVSLLRSSRQPATVSTEELNVIDQAAMRAADLTKRLLAFGRKTDDPQRSVRLSEAVANCEALLKTMIDRRIEWINDLPGDMLPVSFNPTDFNQIVFNLVLNARDTLLEKLAGNSDAVWKPRLAVSVCQMPAGFQPPRATGSRAGVTGWQRFSVTDNGMGIPHDVVERIFEPFYTTKEVGKGTGLGLSMVWHQVTDAGGDIEVDSRPGEGTTFHVYLPCRETRPPMEPAKKPDTGGFQARAVGHRILIVEDEPLILSTAAKILERLGHTVSRQADGLKAWDELAGGFSKYDLLLIDLSMPNLSGIDLVKRVRSVPYNGSIVVMSGRVSDEDLRALKDLKVDRLLTKPFNTDQLMATVGDVLAARRV